MSIPVSNTGRGAKRWKLSNFMLSSKVENLLLTDLHRECAARVLRPLSSYRIPLKEDRIDPCLRWQTRHQSQIGSTSKTPQHRGQSAQKTGQHAGQS